MKSWASERLRHRGWEASAFAIYLVVGVLPIAAGLIYALAYSVGLAGLLGKGFTLAHWTSLAGQADVWLSLLTSALIAAATMFLTLLAGACFALGLRTRLRQGVVAYVVYFPLALPATVAAFFVFQALSDAGLLARVFHALGFIQRPGEFPAMIHDFWNLGVIAAFLILSVPYFTLFFSQVYRTEHLEELCRLTLTLGGKRRDCLRRVIGPIFWRRGRSHIVLWFIAMFGGYEIPLLLGRQTPQMISVLTMRKYQMFDLASKPQAFIAALLYFAIVSLLMLWAFRDERLDRDV